MFHKKNVLDKTKERKKEKWTRKSVLSLHIYVYFRKLNAQMRMVWTDKWLVPYNLILMTSNDKWQMTNTDQIKNLNDRLQCNSCEIAIILWIRLFICWDLCVFAMLIILTFRTIAIISIQNHNNNINEDWPIFFYN